MGFEESDNPIHMNRAILNLGIRIRSDDCLLLVKSSRAFSKSRGNHSSSDSSSLISNDSGASRAMIPLML